MLTSFLGQPCNHPFIFLAKSCCLFIEIYVYQLTSWNKVNASRLYSLKLHSVASYYQLVPADQLLVFQVGEGWERLCQFLEKEVPDIPFPMENVGGNKGTHSSNLSKIILYYNVFLYIIFQINAYLPSPPFQENKKYNSLGARVTVNVGN